MAEVAWHMRMKGTLRGAMASFHVTQSCYILGGYNIRPEGKIQRGTQGGVQQ
jgi:hypothetical protein